VDVIRSIFAAFKSAFEGDWTAFGENLRAAWDTAWARISEVLTNAKDTIIGIAAGLILDLIAKFGDTDWTQLGKDVIDGIVQGLANGATAIVGKMQEIGDAAYSAWQGFWNSSSPSRLAMEGAGDVTDGFLVQWERDKSALANAAAALGQSAYAGMFGTGGIGSAQLSGTGGGSGATITNNYYLQADYRMQDERSLRDDIRMLQMLTG
jgi:hypothetical protein